MLVLHVPQGCVQVAFDQTAAAALAQRLQTLKQSWQQPIPRPEWHFGHTGAVALELFCNPNLWPSPLVAQVLVTVRHPQVQVSTQLALPQLLDDVAAYYTPT
ncbi:hypothetical protein [Gloeomargarita sp.]